MLNHLLVTATHELMDVVCKMSGDSSKVLFELCCLMRKNIAIKPNWRLLQSALKEAQTVNLKQLQRELFIEEMK